MTMTDATVPHPGYVLLYVDDPTASSRFYADLLAAEPVEASPTFVLFACDSGLKLGLWSRHTVRPAPGAEPGAGELGFRVVDKAAVDAAHVAWQAKGVKMLAPPIEQEFGRSFVALDPDGHRLRVYALAAGGG